MRSTLPALALCLVLCASVWAQEDKVADPAPAQNPPAVEKSPAAEIAPGKAPKLPHIAIDHKKGHVDVDAIVTLREGDWLELLACTKGTKEHEAILVVEARPSHIHMALLMVGLEPGNPMRWQQNEAKDGYQIIEARGPKVAITLIYEMDGKTVETPAHEWIVNQQTGKTLDDNIWLFTGSEIMKFDDEPPVFAADVNGTAISLVTFGDELLGKQTNVTNETDNAMWTARTRFIPPLNTKVIIRLTPVKERKEEANPKTDASPKSEAADGQGNASEPKAADPAK